MNELELVQIYSCACRPTFVYRNKQSFQQHFKSQRHLHWQSQQEEQHFREQIIQLENQISSLKVERNMWRDLAMRLKRQYEPTDLLD